MSYSDPAVMQVLQSALACLVSEDPNEEVLRQATKTINEALKRPEGVLIYVQIMVSAAEPAVRQIAGVMARKGIAKFWGRFPDEMQRGLQAVLLQRVEAEEHAPARNAVAEVIGRVASITVPVGRWPELLPFLHRFSQSDVAQKRELALKLFGIVASSLLTNRRNRALKPEICAVVARALADARNDAAVKCAALATLERLVPSFDCEKDVADFRDGVLPHVLSTLQQCLAEGEGEGVATVFEVFESVMELKLKAVASCIPVLAQVSLELAAQQQTVPFCLRHHALTLIEWIVTYKPSAVKRHNMLPAIMAVVFPVCAEVVDADERDDLAVTPHQYAADLLLVMSESLPSRAVFDAAAPYISQYLQRDDAPHKKAALAAIAVLADACSVAMRPHLPQLVTHVLACFQVPDKEVYMTACIVVNALAENLVPDIIAYHPQIVPVLLAALQSPDPVVQRKGLLTLEVFVANLRDEIRPYLRTLMERLLALCATGALEVKDVAAATIGSVMEACTRDDFAPYAEATFSVLRPLIHLAAEDEQVAKGRAIESLGLLAKLMGKESFASCIAEVTAAAMTAFDAQGAYCFDLEELTLSFFSIIVRCFGNDFAPFIPTLMPHVLKLICAEEYDDGDLDGGAAAAVSAAAAAAQGMAAVDAGDGDAENEAGAAAEKDDDATIGGDDDDDDEEDDDDEDDDDPETSNTLMRMQMSFYECKATGYRLIGEMSDVLPMQMAPYVEQIMKALKGDVEHPHEELRANAIVAYKMLLRVALAVFPSPAPNQLHPNTRAFLDMLMKTLLKRIDKDPELVPVVTAVEAIGDVCHVCGDAGIAPYYPDVCKRLLRLIRRKALCQKMAEEDEYDDEGEAKQDGAAEGEENPTEDREAELFEELGTTIALVARAVGNGFAPFFMTILPHLVRLCNTENAHYFRSMAISTVAEVVRTAKLDPTPFLDGAMHLILQGVRDLALTVRHNAVFAAGILLSNAGPNGYPYHLQVLALLAPCVQLTAENELKLRDNAVSSVGRIMCTGNPAFPLEQVLPAWLGALPLQRDFEEWDPVITAFVYLATTVGTRATALPTFADKFVISAAHAANALLTEDLESAEPLKATLATAAPILKSILSASNSAKAAASSLPQPLQAALQQLLA